MTTSKTDGSGVGVVVGDGVTEDPEESDDDGAGVGVVVGDGAGDTETEGEVVGVGVGVGVEKESPPLPLVETTTWTILLFSDLGVPFIELYKESLFTGSPEKLFQFETLFPTLIGSILSIEFFELESPKYHNSPTLPTTSITTP